MPYIPPPRSLEAFPDAKSVKPKTFIPNTNKQRKRWKDADYIYEWDYQHGTIEKYDKKGNHLGEYHPETGEQVKFANPNRNVEP